MDAKQRESTELEVRCPWKVHSVTGAHSTLDVCISVQVAQHSETSKHSCLQRLLHKPRGDHPVLCDRAKNFTLPCQTTGKFLRPAHVQSYHHCMVWSYS
eukprot:6130334-Amphidinium_carterae.3